MTIMVPTSGAVDLGALITLTAAAAGTFTSPVQENVGGRGLIVVMDITVATTTSVVLTIYGIDAASGKRYAVLASAAKTTVTTTPMFVTPGGVVTANISANAQLPPLWQLEAVVTGASSALTATIGAAVTL